VRDAAVPVIVPNGLRAALLLLSLFCAQALVLLLSEGPYAAAAYRPASSRLPEVARVPLAPTAPRPVVKPVQRTGPFPVLSADSEGGDLGEVRQGAKARHKFVIRNTGKGPARLERTWTSCGCTATSLSKTVLQPGESLPVEVSFVAGARGGEFRKWVHVYSDDPLSPLRLYVKGRIRPLYALEPPVVDFGTLGVGQTAQRTVVIRALEPRVPFKPVKPQSRLPAVQVSDLKPVRGGVSFVLTARPTAPGERLRETLNIATGNDASPLVTLPLNGRVPR